MANTKKTPQKCREESDDYIGGHAHKHCQLNQWTEEAMAAAIMDYNQLTQPLDKTPFATLKTVWNENLTEYLFEHAGCGMPKMDFFYVFWPAWKHAMTKANIKSGFRHTGILPANPAQINPALLGLSQATDNMANLDLPGKEMC